MVSFKEILNKNKAKRKMVTIMHAKIKQLAM